MQISGCLFLHSLLLAVLSGDFSNIGILLFMVVMAVPVLVILATILVTREIKGKQKKKGYRIRTIDTNNNQKEDKVLLDERTKNIYFSDVTIPYETVDRLYITNDRETSSNVRLVYTNRDFKTDWVTFTVGDTRGESPHNQSLLHELQRITDNAGMEGNDSHQKLSAHEKEFSQATKTLAQALQSMNPEEDQQLEDALKDDQFQVVKKEKFSVFQLDSHTGEYIETKELVKKGFHLYSQEDEAIIGLFHTFDHIYIVSRVENEANDSYKLLYDFKENHWFHDGPWRANLQAMILFMRKYIENEFKPSLIQTKEKEKKENWYTQELQKINEEHRKKELHHQRHYKPLNKL